MSTGYIPAEDFEPIEDMSHVSDYRWNDRVVNHLFCQHCGIYPYHGDEKHGYRVNLGCVEGLEVHRLPIRWYDGQAMTLNPTPGAHPGD